MFRRWSFLAIRLNWSLQTLYSEGAMSLDPVVEALIRDEVSTTVSSAVNETQNNLLSAFDQMISSKLESVKSQISENQKQLPESQISKIQNNTLCTDGYSFKRNGCEDQFKLNVKLMEKIRDADFHLERSQDSTTLAAREKLSEGDYLCFPMMLLLI